MGRTPEDEGGKQADNNEVGVMNADEVDGRQDGTKPRGGALVSSTLLHGVEELLDEAGIHNWQIPLDIGRLVTARLSRQKKTSKAG